MAVVSSVPQVLSPNSSHGTPSMMHAKMIEYADFPEPLFPDALAETASNADTISLASARRATWSASASTTGRDRAGSRNAVVSSSHNRDMSRLFKD